MTYDASSYKEYIVRVYPDTIKWYIQDYAGHIMLHREDGPAVEYKNGDYEYFRKELLHNDKGPARCITKITVNGKKQVVFQHFVNGKLHNEHGPSVYGDGVPDEYYLKGKHYKYQYLYETDLASLKEEKVCEDKIITIDGQDFKLVPIRSKK